MSRCLCLFLPTWLAWFSWQLSGLEVVGLLTPAQETEGEGASCHKGQTLGASCPFHHSLPFGAAPNPDST